MKTVTIIATLLLASNAIAAPPGYKTTWRIAQCQHCKDANHTFNMTPSIFSQIDIPIHQKPTLSKLRSITTCINPKDSADFGQCKLFWYVEAK